MALATRQAQPASSRPTRARADACALLELDPDLGALRHDGSWLLAGEPEAPEASEAGRTVSHRRRLLVPMPAAAD
jgi:hypothetical protein